MVENEKWLIDADEKQIIIQALKMRHDSQFTQGVYEHSILGKAALLLESTVYAVEVVRCKDCKYFSIGGADHPWCRHESGLNDDVEPDYFCSYGERRTDV